MDLPNPPRCNNLPSQFAHPFVSWKGYDIRTVKELLGERRQSTTMGHARIVEQRGARGVQPGSF